MDDVKVQWQELCEDYKKLEEAHATYLNKLRDLTTKQNACISQINHQRYRLKTITTTLKSKPPSDILDECMKRETQLQIIEESLPRQGGIYLKIILGNLNVGFLSQEAKFKYKDAYEKFKLVCMIISAILIVTNMFVSMKFFQKLYLFYVVWYYCTITIRESILRANGSKINSWWRIHHGLSVFAAIVLLVWPENSTWDEFNPKFLRYSLYTCLVQFLQFNYQKGALYRLKALGQKDNMDITIEGFQFWMWRGLAFLYPFLFAAYVYQLILVVSLYTIYTTHPEATWHVAVFALFMLTFFVGNTTTTLLVIPSKIRNRVMNRYKLMSRKLYNAVAMPNKGHSERKSN